ncbi:MAG: ankyrin repeat domain-containing protein [Spirochaetales bacterium]|nr:ankyrin repeat domain-containing protein [Spirochaetales bacterium]
MKVLILSSSQKIETAEKIKALCRQFGSNPTIYSNDIKHKSGLSSCLEKNDLIIIIWDNNSIFNTEIIFSTGFFSGLNKPFVIFGNQNENIPSCNGKAVLISSENKLKEYILAEFVRIKNAKYIEEAKEKILEMGFELSNRDLFDIVSEGESLALEQFLNAGFSPNICDTTGVSLLNIAIRKGHINIASILLDKGSNINSISGDRGNTPLMDAAAESNTEILIKLIKAGAELDLKSKSGQTALVLSVGRQAEDSAIVLIESGADITIKDDLGMSARKYAELFKLEKVLLIMDKEND